jgi:transposase
VIPGVPPAAVVVLVPLLASGRTSAAAAGLALGVSKTVAYEYLSAMRDYGWAEVTGGGRSAGWQLPQQPEIPEDKREQAENYAALRRYATLEDLAQAVHDGQVDADDDARTLLEKVRRIYARKRLAVLPGDEE